MKREHENPRLTLGLSVRSSKERLDENGLVVSSHILDVWFGCRRRTAAIERRDPTAAIRDNETSGSNKQIRIVDTNESLSIGLLFDITIHLDKENPDDVRSSSLFLTTFHPYRIFLVWGVAKKGAVT